MSEVPLDPEEFVGEPPAGDATPDGYMSNDQSAAASEGTGEPSTTPHDEEPDEEDL
jgi:hypothetical protein